MDILKTQKVKARKKHTCMFCGCAINAGEIYQRDTLKYDGDIYDWVSHTDCMHAISVLEMYDYADDNGITADDFSKCVYEYLYAHYTDETIDDLPEHINKMSMREKVKMILDDISRVMEE